MSDNEVPRDEQGTCPTCCKHAPGDCLTIRISQNQLDFLRASVAEAKQDVDKLALAGVSALQEVKPWRERAEIAEARVDELHRHELRSAAKDAEIAALRAEVEERTRERDEAIRVTRTDDVVNVPWCGRAASPPLSPPRKQKGAVMSEVDMQVFAVYMNEYPDEGSTHVIAWGESDAIAKQRKEDSDDGLDPVEYAAVRVYGPASEAACKAWVEGWGEGYEAAEKCAAVTRPGNREAVQG